MKLKHGLDPLIFACLVEGQHLLINEDNELSLSFRMYHDKRHSWLEVPLVLLAYLRHGPDKFSKYSYIDIKKGMIYLEEDVDVSVFYELLKSHPTHNTTDRISRIYSEATGDVIFQEIYEDLSQYTIAEGNFLDSIHVSLKDDGEQSAIRDLAPNSKGASIH
jgi:hypothetical protein